MLGVDDFALYGGTYETLLVDATTRLPLTLWEGRDAEQLSHWLRKHPGVEVACRDGSLACRQGITADAPDAAQVSDRFHLWQGLSRRVQDIASAHHGCLPAALPPDREKDPPHRSRRPRRTPGPAPCPKAARSSACPEPHRPEPQLRGPGVRPGPPHRAQVRPSPNLAGSDAPPAPQALHPGPLPRPVRTFAARASTSWGSMSSPTSARSAERSTRNQQATTSCVAQLRRCTSVATARAEMGYDLGERTQSAVRSGSAARQPGDPLAADDCCTARPAAEQPCPGGCCAPRRAGRLA
ncbi:transposase [Streptomyces anulatus]|uniref:transposase n=1 Tax=Streptomyces anulatus TaxID=1892 RepID=UPI0036A8C347